MSNEGKFSLSRSEVRCLREIYRQAIENNKKVTSVYLSKIMKIKPPSVIDILRKLSKKGLIIRRLWSHIELTDLGIRKAREILHHHRVIEEFYIRVIGLDPETAHIEASKIDYIVDCKIISRLYDLIGNPEYCSHGYPFYKGFCR